MRYLPFILAILIFDIGHCFAQDQSSFDVPRPYMSPDSLLIMGELPILTTRDKLILTLGEPDSVVVTEGECPGYFSYYCRNEYELMYWGSSYFEVCEDRAIVGAINFDETESIYLIYNNEIKLNHETTVDYMREYYPETVSSMSDISVHQRGVYQSFGLPDQPVRAESGWIFFFRNDKLKMLHYWIPC